jgi:uncharacterized protein (TIGR03435 family)
MGRANVLCGLTGLFLFASSAAQGQAAPKLEFEVASIKPAAPQANGASGVRGGPGTPDPGRVTYTNVNLRMLLDNAYDVLDDQISGPGWLATERYDILATIPLGTSKEQFRVMLQNLLAARFQLSFHREKKEFPVYELAAAKNGPKLKLGAAVPDTRPNAGRGGTADSNGFPLPPTHQTAQRSVNGVAKMAANQITMTAFAQFLKFPMGFMGGNPLPGGNLSLPSARVLDKTGLDGEFSFTLEYEWPGPGGSSDPGGAPTLFTSLQQQLGLRLDQTKQVFDVLVIDRVEKTPTEN